MAGCRDNLLNAVKSYCALAPRLVGTGVSLPELRDQDEWLL